MNLEKVLKKACKLKDWTYEKTGDDTFAVSVDTDDGRKQTVTVYGYEEDGENIVGFQTVIGHALGLLDDKPMQALKMNAEFRYGALGIDENDQLVMIEKLPESKTDGPVASVIIRYLARRADMIEKYVFEAESG
jgi:hypothetical protein